MRHPVLSIALALLAITLAAGCAKKQKPVTPPAAGLAAERAAAPAPAPEPLAAPASEPDSDPFAGDLASKATATSEGPMSTTWHWATAAPTRSRVTSLRSASAPTACTP